MNFRFLKKIICFSISGNQFFFAFFSALTESVLHSYDSIKTFVVKMSEYILVVDLTGIRFLPVRLVTYLNIYDLILDPIDICDKFSFIFLIILSFIKYLVR